jgi:hypothetical protein
VDAAAARDAESDVHDAPLGPDCRCPPADYFIDAIVDGAPVRLPSAFRLSLYCDETAAELAHPPCGSLYRLSGCAGQESARPCPYFAIGGHTPVTGFFVDATGQTFELVSADITMNEQTGRLAIGSVSAVYASRTSEALRSVTGTFRVCTTLFHSCRT